MSRYPHTKLFGGPVRSVVITGPHIQVLDTKTGSLLHATTNLSPHDKDAVVKSGPILCAAITHDGKYLSTTGIDKHLKVWDLESLTLMSARELPKRPTVIEFTKADDILVADKFGDVSRYPLHPDLEDVSRRPKNDALAAHETPSGGDLVLGHVSVLTGCLLTHSEDFIITCDRDEHIRVSWYPEGHVIQAYCLGHKKFVSAIHIPPFAPTCLVSGGGDPELKVWDWMTGRLQRNITVLAVAEPFIMVRAQKRRRKSQRDGEGSEDNKGKGKQIYAGKEKGDVPADETEDPTIPFVDMSRQDTDETVFAIRRISSFASEDGNHIVFTIIGGTALFAFNLAEDDDQPSIRYFDCGSPVLDFTIMDHNSIWILLDKNFGENPDTRGDGNAVRVVTWLHGQFVEGHCSPLLESLHSVCQITATPSGLEALDLYSDLTSLPKHLDDEPGDQEHGKSTLVGDQADASSNGTPVVGSEKGLKKRALGRLKHKLALQQLQQVQSDRAHSETPETPDTRRSKSEIGDDQIEYS